MRKYEIDYIDPETGAISPIDNVEKEYGYTAEDYVRDCEENADDAWIDMLHRGAVKVEMLDMTDAECRELAQNLGWDPTDKEDTLDSLRTNWDEPLTESDVQTVYEYLVEIWDEKNAD